MKKVTIIDVDDLPRNSPAADDLRKVWTDWELGNDFYYLDYDNLDDGKYPELQKFVESLEIEGDKLLHYWW